MKDKLHYVWGVFLVVFTLYSFWGKALFGSIIPALATDKGWLVGLLVLAIGGSAVLVFCNAIEELHDPPAGEGHGHH